MGIADAHRRLAELYDSLARIGEAGRERAVHVERRLEASPYIAGERFTAADVAMAGNIAYVMQQGWLPKKPAFEDYVARTKERPAAKRAGEKDMAMAKTVPAFKAMFQKQ